MASNIHSNNTWDIIRIKADLLCMGIRSNENSIKIYTNQNPSEDYKTGNVGLHISLNGYTNVLVTASHSFDQRSPYSFEYIDGNLSLCRDKKELLIVEEIRMPKWYNKKTSSTSPMSTFFLHEGSSFLHQTYAGCDYHSEGLQCKFCGAGTDWRMGTPIEIAKTVSTAYLENSKYQVCLGGGAKRPTERKISYFLECVREIRNNNPTIPIWIEMVPPDSDDDIVKLFEMGATSFGFNLEIWDDGLRKEICPGKSQISKAKYFNAFMTALSVVGRNRVGSCLIVGLEPIDSSIIGAIALASQGVQPCLLPFKPWDGSQYSDRPPCNPSDLLQVSESAVDAMIEYGISPDNNQGCLLCESCTIDHDIYKFKLMQSGGN